MPKQFSTEEKIVLIKQAKNGCDVSALCKEVGISRTVFYLWLKAYDITVQKTKEAILALEQRRSKEHWWNNKKLEQAILEIALNHPSYSPEQIIPLLDPIWKQKEYASFLKLTTEQKMEMMRLYESGIDISEICRKYRVSRMTFYKWLKRYEESNHSPSSLENQAIPSGEKHYRYVHEAPGLILKVISEHPEYSTSQITGELEKLAGYPILTVSSVYRILQSMSLTTYEKRLAYANTQRSVLPDVTPQEIKQQRIQTLSLSKQLALISIVSFIVFLSGSLVLDTFLHADSIFTRIGYFFSFSALFCGLLFFLYSLRYYITIGIVLSSTRQDEQEYHTNQLSSFFRKIFGFSIEITTIPSSKSVNNRLNYDVSSITLEREPFVSIQVGTYNEKRVIDRFLLAATSMDYANYEVIVADDSNDETVSLLERWQEHPKVKISHRDTRSGYKGAALKEALKHIDPRTEFLFIFDADFIPYPDTITQFLKYFQYNLGNLQPGTIHASPIAAVQGYQWHVLNKSENWITRAIRSEYSGSYVIERSGIQINRGLEQIAGSVYMIRLDALNKIGWGTSITEDFELTLKLYAQGFKVIYTPYIQTPAEAVSTVKRLIRQRMRWAEGHSFNVKKMFWTLLSPSSPLSLAEKFEFIYLGPYYLQALFLLLGTFCWFTAEVIFRTRLPFWTEVWGWSLVFTNIFSIPLMNLIGLFIEESEERDYIGLFAFVALSYIVAPFQAFAAVKGFLEKEEGPWFRTPKTGRITDNFIPGRFSRFIKSFFGQSSVSSISMRMATGFFALNATNSAFAPFHPSFATTKTIPSFKNRFRWTGKTVLAFCLVLTLFLNYLTFFSPQKAEAAWYNSGYLRKKAITIDHTKVGQVSFDATSSVQAGTGTSIPAWSFTVGNNSNRLLIVGIAISASGVTVASNGVTYNGVALTKLDSLLYKSNTEDDEFWYMLNPPTGANNVAVSFTGGSTNYVAAAVSYYSVNQTTPFGTDAKNSGTGTSASTTVTTAANQLVVDVFASDTVNGHFAPTSPQTLLYDNHATFPQGTASSVSSAGTSTTMQWTDASSDNWADIAVGINPSDLSSFPMLFSRTDTDFKTVANGGLVQNTTSRGNGITVPDDLVFVDSTETTKLDHEIEKYVTTTGEIETWIRIPTLSATTDTVIYVYFDNSSVSTSQENATGVWDSNYLGSWHMSDNAANTTVSDSSSNANNGTNVANTSTKTTTGEIAGGLTYNGTNDNTNTTAAGSIKGQAQVTISAWVNTGSLNGNQHEIYMEPTNGAASTTRIALVIYGATDSNCNGNEFCFFGRTSDSDAKTTFVKSSTALSTGTWYYVVAVYDSTNSINHLMINGVDQATARTQSAFSSTTPIHTPTIGNQADGSQWFSGTIDEVRLSKTVRTPGWSETEYLNQSSPSTFYNISTIATNSSTAAIEQQINIKDQENTGAGDIGMVYVDTTKYTGATYYFEVTALVTSGTGSVTLNYGAGSGSTMSGGSTITISGISSTSYARYRSSSFSLTSGNADISAMSGTGINVAAARIIIDQNSSTLITDTETQAEMGGFGGNESTTATSYTALTSPKYFKYDTTKYDGTVTVYFDATLVDYSGIMKASLFTAGSSCTSQVSSSEVTSGNGLGTHQRIRSSALSLTSGTTYMVCFKSTDASTAQLVSAKLIIDQHASGGLTKVETYALYNMVPDTTTNTSFTGNPGTFYNQYDPSVWSGGAFTYYFESTILATSGTTSQQLYNVTDSSAISGSVITTTNTTPTLVRSGSVTMPTAAKSMEYQLKSSVNTSTAKTYGAWLVIDVLSLTTPEHIWFLFPLIFFLPKMLLRFRRKKGRIGRFGFFWKILDTGYLLAFLRLWILSLFMFMFYKSEYFIRKF